MRTPAPNWWRICSPPNQGDPRKKGRDNYFQLCSIFFRDYFQSQLKGLKQERKDDYFQLCSPPNQGDQKKNGSDDYFQLCWKLFSQLFPTLVTNQLKEPKQERERRLFPTLLKIIFHNFFQLCSPPNKRDPSKKGEAIIFNSVKPLLQFNSHSGMRVILYEVACKNTQDALTSKFVVKVYPRGQPRVGTGGIISVITR